MEKIILLNGSPRAPRSNSKLYAESFIKKSKCPCKYINLTKSNHHKVIETFHDATQVVLVFPLYVDGIPSTLLSFLKDLEMTHLPHKPVISVLINCGFIEFEQNEVALDMVRFFCKQNQYDFGSILSIGGGEAMMTTPFKLLAHQKIGSFAKSIAQKKYKTIAFTMPLSKKTYIKASTRYWTNYGMKHHVTKEEMQTMKIE